MKNKLVFIVYSIAIISCSNSTSTKAITKNITQSEEKETYLTATINGDAWLANHKIQSYTMDNKIMLGGENDNWVLGIKIPDNATAGQTINTNASVAKKMKGSSNIL